MDKTQEFYERMLKAREQLGHLDGWGLDDLCHAIGGSPNENRGLAK